MTQLKRQKYDHRQLSAIYIMKGAAFEGPFNLSIDNSEMCTVVWLPSKNGHYYFTSVISGRNLSAIYHEQYVLYDDWYAIFMNDALTMHYIPVTLGHPIHQMAPWLTVSDADY